MTEIKNNTNLIDNSKYVDFYTAFELPYAITGYSYVSQIRDEKGNLIATFTIAQDNVLNKIALSLTPLQKTSVIASKAYKYDIVETNPSSKERIIVRGDYFCFEGASR